MVSFPVTRCGLIAGALVLAVLAPTGVAPLDAQVVTGRVTVAGSGDPVSAALVELVNSDSAQIAAALTDPQGRYTMRSSVSGTFSLRVRRLGYATRTLERIVVTGAHRVDVEVTTAPVQLDGVVATGRPVCEDGPGVGAGTQRLWDLVVAALDVARLAQALDTYRFDMLLYVRDRTLDRRHLLLDVVERSWETGAFVAMPIETLEDQGYVEPHRGGVISFFMPDPVVLVSDHFLETHCFRVVESDDPGLVGLGFDPTPQRRGDRPDERDDSYEQLFGNDVVEVRGVLWVDRGTGALSQMEYDYVGIRDPDVDALAGGSARFEQLSGGLWIVRQWLLRMPRLRDEDGTVVPEARREAGGYVVNAFGDAPEGDRSPADPSADPAAPSTALPGTMGGDLVGRLVASDVPLPVSDATVRLSGSPRAVRPDSAGGFAFRDVPPGEYVVTWSSPHLEAIGLPPRGVDVSIEHGTEQTVVVPGPDLNFAVDYLCPGMEVDPGLGIIRAHAPESRLGTTASPEGTGSIDLRWVTLQSTDPDVEFERSVVARGEFLTLCGVPTGVPLEANLGDSLPPIPVELGPHEIRGVGRRLP